MLDESPGSRRALIGCLPADVCFRSDGAVTAPHHPGWAVNHAGFRPTATNRRCFNYEDGESAMLEMAFGLELIWGWE